jgi:hypothetical protein
MKLAHIFVLVLAISSTVALSALIAAPHAFGF